MPMETVAQRYIRSQRPQTQLRGESVRDEGLTGVETLVDVLPQTADPFLKGVDPLSSPISFRRFREFILCDQAGFLGCLAPSSRVGLCMPSGPALASMVVTTVARACACPVRFESTPDEIEAELRSFRASAVVIQDGADNGHIMSAATALRITVVTLKASPTVSGQFRLHCRQRPASRVSSGNAFTRKSDVALVLHTSGTSGTKKVVPYRLETLLVGAVCIAAGWELSPTDCCCGMMPLFHIGGVARTLLAVLISGSSSICCPAFDPTTVWRLIASRAFSWYYAGPTLHRMIVQEASSQPRQARAHAASGTVRMIANAAGGLLPSLAAELQTLFGGATILPGYGMTECMPISSPPPNYRLDREGTSGLPSGPSLRILDTHTGKAMPVGQTGAICVKGPPLFEGYEAANEADRRAGFTKDGWFDTGDAGYVDRDGFLFITGRNKEIINRGGEVISPMEVEEAMRGCTCMCECLAFSVPHPVLQETVGLAVVVAGGRLRPDLSELQRVASLSLGPNKWPQTVVFMRTLPKTSTGKLLRIKLATRLGLPPISEDMEKLTRTFEVQGPPLGTPLSVPIKGCTTVVIRESAINASLDQLVSSSVIDRAALSWRKANSSLVAVVEAHRPDAQAHVLAHLQAQFHQYEIPQIVVTQQNLAAKGNLELVLEESMECCSSNLTDSELAVRECFVAVLGSRAQGAGPSSDFFTLGGTSLEAGMLAAKLRASCDLPRMTVTRVFELRTLAKFAALVDSDSVRKVNQEASSVLLFDEPRQPNYSSTNMIALLMQLLPLAVIFPARRGCMFLLFVFLVSDAQSRWFLSPIPALALASIATHFAFQVLLPLVAIVSKWVLIGRHQPGRYKLWGQYYIRWWLSKNVVDIVGPGIFATWNTTAIWWLRAMGACIGPGCRFSNINLLTLGEHDLLTFEANCEISTGVVCRAFCLDECNMVLAPIVVGAGSTLGPLSIISPGATLAPGTHLGPRASSHNCDHASEHHIDSCSTSFPEPPLPWKMAGYCLVRLVDLVSLLPYFIGLVALCSFRQGETTCLAVPGACYGWCSTEPDCSSSYVHTRNVSYEDALVWMSSELRLVFFVCLRVVRAVCTPVVRFGCAVVIKRCIIGRFEPSPRAATDSGWQLLRHWLAQRLFSSHELQELFELIGTHYEVRSQALRMLGASVGTGVYWPGIGPSFAGQWDLIEVGDNVTFGSRSMIIVADRTHAAPVKLEAGSMLADNCVLLPGATLQTMSILGSGSVSQRGYSYEAGSVYLGIGKHNAQMLKAADVPELLLDPSSVDTANPYSKAMAASRAASPYHVIGAWGWVAVHVCCRCISAAVAQIPLVATLVLAHSELAEYIISRDRRMMEVHSVKMIDLTTSEGFVGVYNDSGWSELEIQSTSLNYVWGMGIHHTFYLHCIALYMCCHFVHTLWLFAMDIACKWCVVGNRRHVGDFPYDENDYSQRWKLHTAFKTIVNCNQIGTELTLLGGSAYLPLFYRMMGARIGSNVCLYPTGASPKMTEPELTEIGDGTCVDRASIVCHINTSGKLSLNTLKIGRHCTLRSHTRLQSGACMEDGATLLENTLVLGGDSVSENTIVQGWPRESIWAAPARTTPYMSGGRQNPSKQQASSYGYSVLDSTDSGRQSPTSSSFGLATPLEVLNVTGKPFAVLSAVELIVLVIVGLESGGNSLTFWICVVGIQLPIWSIAFLATGSSTSGGYTK